MKQKSRNIKDNNRTTKRFLFVPAFLFVFLTLMLACDNANNPCIGITDSPLANVSSFGTPHGNKEDVGLKGEGCIQYILGLKEQQEVSKRNGRRNTRSAGGEWYYSYSRPRLQEQPPVFSHLLPIGKVHTTTRACDYYIYALRHILI